MVVRLKKKKNRTKTKNNNNKKITPTLAYTCWGSAPMAERLSLSYYRPNPLINSCHKRENWVIYQNALGPGGVDTTLRPARSGAQETLGYIFFFALFYFIFFVFVFADSDRS